MLAARYAYKVYDKKKKKNCFIFLNFRWRLFRRPIIAQPDCVILYSKAAIALHNYLWTRESSIYCPADFVDGEDGVGNVIMDEWRADEDACTGMQTLPSTSSNW